MTKSNTTEVCWREMLGEKQLCAIGRLEEHELFLSMSITSLPDATMVNLGRLDSIEQHLSGSNRGPRLPIV